MRSRAALVVLSLFLLSCKTPPVPPEAAQANDLEHELWRAGALSFAPQPYAAFRERLRQANNRLSAEKSKFAWFRDYEGLQKDFRSLSGQARDLLQSVERAKRERASVLQTRRAEIQSRSRALRQSIQPLSEAEEVRQNLTRAELASAEAGLSIAAEEFDRAAERLGAADAFLEQAQRAVLSILSRYLDRGQMKEWQRLVDASLRESKRRGTTVVIIKKLERELTVFRKGESIATYGIGLGRFGLMDKLHAGDDATPEGRYKIIKKLGRSKFYKALLLDYPNEEDRRRFAQAQRAGLLPSTAAIGGLIEIHGGGQDSLTEGCISVDDSVMDRIFPMVEVGTTVTIVGTMRPETEILQSLKTPAK